MTGHGSRSHSHFFRLGEVTAELAENEAARALARLLPLTIDMGDHPRQEKTGHLPSPLPDQERQRDFSSGMLGLWDFDHFVIYYRGGCVPLPGIVVLGQVIGDVSIFDRPGGVSVRIKREEKAEPLWSALAGGEHR